MLINTLFLSKPLTDSDYLSKSEGSDKMFGFLFSEIINVDNQSEKLGLVPEHIGGNLIDYKSVFINYNFESNVIISTPEIKVTKDPIICLSKLFLEEILDNQKINEPEKIIYSPQQFVNSFTQLIKSLVENNPSSENVELKLFSKNFILSQNIDSNQIQNIEKFISETIENESSFSLTLRASGKQILFEIFSQVVPSILEKESFDVKNTDYTEDKTFSLENKSPNQILSSNNSQLNESLSDSLFVSTEEKLNNESGKESSLLKDVQFISFEKELTVSQNKSLTETFDSESINENITKDSHLKNNFNKVHNSKIINSLLEGNREEIVNNTDLSNSLFSENSSIKNKNRVNSFNILSSANKNEQKSTIELTDSTLKKSSPSVNFIIRNESSSPTNSGNPQIKIIIQSDNQNQVLSNTKVNSEIISKISATLGENEGQEQSVLSAKITTNSQSQQNKNSSVNNEQFFQNNFISDRQIQNLFRLISLNKQPVQRDLSSSNNVKSQVINEQSLALNLTDENVQNNSQNNSVENFNKDLSVKLNQSLKNELNLNPEIKITKGVVTENSVSNNLQDVHKIYIKNPVNDIIAGKSSNVVVENREQDFSINTNPYLRENNKVFTKDFIVNDIDIPDNENQVINKNSFNKNIAYNTSSSSTDIRKEIVNEPSIGKVTFRELKNPEFISFNKQTHDLKVNDNNEVTSNNSIESIKNEEVPRINFNVNDFQNEVKSGQKTNNEMASLSNKPENQKSNSVSSNKNLETVSNNSLETLDNEVNSTSSFSVKESQKQLKTELKFGNDNIPEAEEILKEEKVSSNSVHQVENSFIKKSKNIPSSEPVLDSYQSKFSDKARENREVKLNNSTNLEEEVSERTDVNLNRTQKDYTSPNKVFRVVTEKPAKGIVGISFGFVQEEKPNTENAKFNYETIKDFKVNEENVRISNKENPQNEKKTDFYNHQEDSTKNSDQDNGNTSNKENNFSKNSEEPSTDFRNTISGFEKKFSPVSSRNNNEAHISSSKFDFKKFFESKSLENFVRTINENNMNYRAELNNLARNSNSVELRLYPEELGRVKILIENSDNVVSAKIEVQSEQVKNIIISNLPQLKESLKQEGLNTQNINVYLGSEEQKGQHSANQKRQNGNNKMIYETEENTEEVKIKNLGYNTIEYLA